MSSDMLPPAAGSGMNPAKAICEAAKTASAEYDKRIAAADEELKTAMFPVLCALARLVPLDRERSFTVENETTEYRLKVRRTAGYIGGPAKFEAALQYKDKGGTGPSYLFLEWFRRGQAPSYTAWDAKVVVAAVKAGLIQEIFRQAVNEALSI